MKEISKKGLLLTLAFMLLLAGCSTGGSSSTETPPSTTTGSPEKTPEASGPTHPTGIEISKPVTLKVLMPGDEPKDMASVAAEINKITQRDLNVTVDWQFLTWTDYKNKYNLILTSGEDMDLVYTATWMDYLGLAQKGAFQALDDILPRAAPEMWNNQTDYGWKQATVDGNIYTMPNENDEYNPDGILYREDLRKKHNLPEINSIETIEAYLKGIKENEPEMMPTIPHQADMNGILDSFLFKDHYAFGVKPNVVIADYQNLSNLNAISELPGFLDGLKLAKKWHDMGLLPKNSASSKENGDKMLEAGKSAAHLGSNPAKARTFIDKVKNINAEWEFGFFPYSHIYKVEHPLPRIGNGFAVPRASKNAERAVMLVNQIHTDQALYDLIVYGIEGKHYKLTSDGKIDTTDFNSAELGFGPDMMNPWGFWVQDMTREIVGGWDGYNKVIAEIASYATPSPTAGFALDVEPVKSESAALNQEFETYYYGLAMGALDDPAEALTKYNERLKAAGLDRFMAEVDKQWEMFLAENN